MNVTLTEILGVEGSFLVELLNDERSVDTMSRDFFDWLYVPECTDSFSLSLSRSLSELICRFFKQSLASITPFLFLSF